MNSVNMVNTHSSSNVRYYPNIYFFLRLVLISGQHDFLLKKYFFLSMNTNYDQEFLETFH